MDAVRMHAASPESTAIGTCRTVAAGGALTSHLGAGASAALAGSA